MHYTATQQDGICFTSADLCQATSSINHRIFYVNVVGDSSRVSRGGLNAKHFFCDEIAACLLLNNTFIRSFRLPSGGVETRTRKA